MKGKNPAPSVSMTLTLLFTDLESSTRLWQEFPEAMKTALARHDELVRAAVEGSNGQVIKTTGDGFLATFASAQDALSACIDAQKSLLEEKWAQTGPLRVRMGLHVGEVQQRGDDYFGTALNRAARLMSVANGGQVLLSTAMANIIADYLPDGFSLRDLGEHRLKDLQRPEQIFQLVHPELPADFPPISSLSRLPNNLPSQPTVFIGRQKELDEINSLLNTDTVRLLTLIGPGGTGKTRLALQSGAEQADRFVDGTYFIDLAPIREPKAVLSTIARTIGVTEPSNGSILEDLKSQLREKKMLLLLDNFEQVTSAAVQVAELLQFCPRLKLLTTSRSALHVRGEQLYPVPPLGLPEIDATPPPPAELVRYEAVQLYIERAQTVNPGFKLTDENAEAVAEICLRLDGLPLAIELAAARISLFSPQALLQRLGDQFKLLRGGARDLPERQQTLRDTIDWSYELLAVHEKTLFEVVSVFSCCTFEAVEAVIGAIGRLDETDLDIVEGLVSLVDKSLVRRSDDGAGEPRLQMLETIREYAVERLKAKPDLYKATSLAHADYFAGFAQRQWRRMAGYEREAAMEELTADIDNLKIAWRYWVDKREFEQLQKMIDGLWSLYDGLGWYQAMVEITTDLLNVLSSTPSTPEQVQQEITLRTSLARALMALKGYTPEVEDAYTRALQLSEGQGEIPQLFPVLRGLSSYYMYRSEFEKGAQIGARILELAESRDDDQMRVHGYLVLGANIAFIKGLQEGLENLEKGIALFDPDKQRSRPYQLGNNPGIVCFTTSAIALWWLGFPDRALKRAARAIELATKLNHPFTMVYALFHMGALHMWMQDLNRAYNHAQAMMDIAVEHDYQLWLSLATILLGAVESLMGKTGEGLARLEQGIASYMGHNTPPVFWPLVKSIHAGAYGRAGRGSDGINMLNGLLEEYGEQSALRLFPELILLRGELLLDKSRTKAADAFRQVLTVTQETDRKMLALQAATRLCKLEMQVGNAEESGRILVEIYNSFTEGFETADLREARAVLDGWRG